MPKIERTNPLAVLAAAAMGAAAGLVVQFALSARGSAPLVPPLSLAVSLALIAAILIGFGIQLRRAVAKRPGTVNPFHAVRLLAASRAGQIVGALFFGFAAGLLLSLLGRTVQAPIATWLPMLFVVFSGATLIVCAAITEWMCRVPPSDGGAEDVDPDVDPGPVDQAAYRKP
ncbi:DUF3180 domain-containing protein [Leucobacter insecticola]|uniref:DUF3180 domain-containing protein n=1 Tax=Leucobacter insecticola TaxID=2714934 RepID=A0A6G8FLP7_9MICO|nr:DUF3180 domain-containing protein [Leucobacter insecticola]QIM17219.1 DUF3180 domain-containing protein [Leucobacter insecticola]